MQQWGHFHARGKLGLSKSSQWTDPTSQAQSGGTDPTTRRLRAPAAQLPQHLLAGGDGVQELPLPLLHRVQQLLGALIPGRLRGWPPAEPQPRLPTVHAGSLPARRKERETGRQGRRWRGVRAHSPRPDGPPLTPVTSLSRGPIPSPPARPDHRPPFGRPLPSAALRFRKAAPRPVPTGLLQSSWGSWSL